MAAQELANIVLAALLLDGNMALDLKVLRELQDASSAIRKKHGGEYHTARAMLDGVAHFANLATTLPGMTHDNVAANLAHFKIPVGYKLKMVIVTDRLVHTQQRARLVVAHTSEKIEEGTPIKFDPTPWMVALEKSTSESLIPRYVVCAIRDVDTLFGYDVCEVTARYPDPTSAQADWKELVDIVMVKSATKDEFVKAKCSILPDGKLVHLADNPPEVGLQCIVRKIELLKLPGY